MRMAQACSRWGKVLNLMGLAVGCMNAVIARTWTLVITMSFRSAGPVDSVRTVTALTAGSQAQLRPEPDMGLEATQEAEGWVLTQCC